MHGQKKHHNCYTFRALLAYNQAAYNCIKQLLNIKQMFYTTVGCLIIG